MESSSEVSGSASRSEVAAAASPADHAYMRRALVLAERGWGRVAPNPLVGCVLVRDGEVVGEGWHAEYGRAHAEVVALLAAGERARGATAYVTLEPCSHHGKTPPCTSALIEAGVARVVYAASDPHPAARGGAEVLRAAGIPVVGGVEEAVARDQNASFFHRYSPLGNERPWIELKLALSLDARIADRRGQSSWITDEKARAEVHRLRAGHDAICVGVGTALADDPRLTVRGAIEPRVPPVRVVFDRSLRLPTDSTLVRTANEVPVWIVCAPQADPARREVLEQRGIALVEAEDLRQGFRALRERGIGSAFVEGGAGIAGELLREGMVDRLTLFYAPVLLGAEALSPFTLEGWQLGEAPRWRRFRTAAFGPDTLISLAKPD